MRYLILFAACCLTGCSIPTKSSGFGPQSSKVATVKLPTNIPHRVQVHITGQYDIARQCEEQFAAGLRDLGFELVNGDDHDGEFIGNVSAESSSVNIDSHLSIRLVEGKSQKTIWNVEAHDPRLTTWSYAVQTSVIHTTRAALAALRRDLSSMQ